MSSLFLPTINLSTDATVKKQAQKFVHNKGKFLCLFLCSGRVKSRVFTVWMTTARTWGDQKKFSFGSGFPIGTCSIPGGMGFQRGTAFPFVWEFREDKVTL